MKTDFEKDDGSFSESEMKQNEYNTHGDLKTTIFLFFVSINPQTDMNNFTVDAQKKE